MLGARLRQARRAAGMTQEQLEAVSGVRQTAISKIERGKQRTSTDTPALAHALGVSTLWLSDGIDVSESDDNHENYVTKCNKATTPEDVVLYQYMDYRCPAARGHGNARGEAPTLLVSASNLARIGITAEQAIGHIQSDDSGGDALAAGDEAIIRADQISPRAHNGRLFALWDGEAVAIRRLTTRATGGLLVTCDSGDKTRFPDEILSAEEADSLHIIGRVCWVGGIR